jgi:DNA primase large subunit
MVKKAISIFFGIEVLIFTLAFFSQKIFFNVEVAFLSAFFVIMASSFAYRQIIHSKVDSGEYEQDRDALDAIDDPYELYDKEINEAPAEELDLKQIVKEEKAKIKTLSLKNAKHGVKGSFSLLRLGAYLFLVLGFIALKNNNLLDLAYYLPSLLVGIVTGSLVSKELFV